MPSSSRPVRQASLRRRRSANQRLQCRVRECDGRRHSLGKFCVRHLRRKERYGHPEGGPIRVFYLQSRRRWMRKFIEMNPDDPDFVAAIARLDQLLASRRPPIRTRYRETPPRDLARQLARLREKGLDGAEVLERVGAVWMLSWDDPALLPDDDRLTFALGREIIHARPLAKRTYTDRRGRERTRSEDVSGAVYHALGRYLRGSLARFFVPVWQHREEMKQAAEDETAA